MINSAALSTVDAAHLPLHCLSCGCLSSYALVPGSSDWCLLVDMSTAFMSQNTNHVKNTAICRHHLSSESQPAIAGHTLAWLL